MKDFVSWLTEQREARGWSASELARCAHMHPSTFSLMFSGLSQPGPDLCLGVAHALQIPPEEVFRRAGLLPPLPSLEDDHVLDELLETARRLSPAERRLLADFALWRYRQQGGEGETK